MLYLASFYSFFCLFHLFRNTSNSYCSLASFSVLIFRVDYAMIEVKSNTVLSFSFLEI